MLSFQTIYMVLTEDVSREVRMSLVDLALPVPPCAFSRPLRDSLEETFGLDALETIWHLGGKDALRERVLDRAHALLHESLGAATAAPAGTGDLDHLLGA